VGSLIIPQPEKLIIHPEKPLCAGAMYSPGFFPNGYLCQPFNHGYYMVRAVAERYGFDPQRTPWNDMSPEARQAFLFGDPEELEVTWTGRSGVERTVRETYPGFYGLIRDWDVGGTYTKTTSCPDCQGARLRPEYLAVRLNGFNIHQLNQMSLWDLEHVIDGLSVPETGQVIFSGSLEKLRRRLRFLIQVGLGYLHLDRVAGTLSAGEVQRVRLAALLSSGLTSLTLLLDEPTRGLHPAEVQALLDALVELREEGNTVVVVEHDPLILRAADHLIDMGQAADARKNKFPAAPGLVERFWRPGEQPAD
jgi:excinuclease ABC subunit A